MSQYTLGDGTQILPLREAYNAPCCCGRNLEWTFSGDPSDDVTATAQCECGTDYWAMFPEIKIEGFKRDIP